MYGKSLKPFRCSIADQDEGTNEQDNEQKSLEKLQVFHSKSYLASNLSTKFQNHAKLIWAKIENTFSLSYMSKQKMSKDLNF